MMVSLYLYALCIIFIGKKNNGCSLACGRYCSGCHMIIEAGRKDYFLYVFQRFQCLSTHFIKIKFLHNFHDCTFPQILSHLSDFESFFLASRLAKNPVKPQSSQVIRLKPDGFKKVPRPGRKFGPYPPAAATNMLLYRLTPLHAGHEDNLLITDPPY